MLTLPLIYILNKKKNINKRLFKLKLKRLIKKNNLNEIKKIIIDEGGIDYAEAKLLEISRMARRKIEIFDHSELKEALIMILEFNLIRKEIFYSYFISCIKNSSRGASYIAYLSGYFYNTQNPPVTS